ncbi:MAG: Na(+)/H(+) antiporter subunit B [Pirellulaceae bacterium]|nr:Na(+)/H(+) antiporter subunit B [Pirellulaceae bacterium]
MAILKRTGFAVLVMLLGAGAGAAVLSLPPEWNGLSDTVAARLDESGVTNPVTAVLLNFRGYDTLLEICVLMLAAFAVGSFVSERRSAGLGTGRGAAETSGQGHRGVELPIARPGRVLTGLVRLLAPWIILVSGYLLWVGSHAPGGAFQAGALLASLGVLIVLCDHRLLPRTASWLRRVLLALGFWVFAGFGLVPLMFGQALLQFSGPAAGWVILGIETACTVSIAMVLLLLFVCNARLPSLDADADRARGTGA